MKGQDYGLFTDLVIGLVGTVVCRFLVSLFVSGKGFWGSIVVAFLGASLLIAFVRIVTPNRTKL